MISHLDHNVALPVPCINRPLLCHQHQHSVLLVPADVLLRLVEDAVIICLTDADKLAVIHLRAHDPLVVELLHGRGDAKAGEERHAWFLSWLPTQYKGGRPEVMTAILLHELLLHRLTNYHNDTDFHILLSSVNTDMIDPPSFNSSNTNTMHYPPNNHQSHVQGWGSGRAFPSSQQTKNGKGMELSTKLILGDCDTMHLSN